MIYIQYIGAALLAMIASVSAHSWVACTDYRGDVNYYQDDKCFGYPRHWKRERGKVGAALARDSKGYHIGVDTGYEYKPSENTACQFPMASPYTAAYTSDYPMATYEKGGVYCLAWPTKNHAAAKCTNQFIPDNQLKLFVSKPNPGRDPKQSEFKLRNINGVEKCRNNNAASCQLGKTKHQSGAIDCEGFQRAPRFCENTDKAMAHACFEVPSWFTAGHYTFQWYWEFNKGEFYSTCWDAKIVAAGKGPKRAVTPGTKGTVKSTLCNGGWGGAGDCKCANNYPQIKNKYLRAIGVEQEDAEYDAWFAEMERTEAEELPEFTLAEEMEMMEEETEQHEEEVAEASAEEEAQFFEAEEAEFFDAAEAEAEADAEEQA